MKRGYGVMLLFREGNRSKAPMIFSMDDVGKFDQEQPIKNMQDSGSLMK